MGTAVSGMSWSCLFWQVSRKNSDITWELQCQACLGLAYSGRP